MARLRTTAETGTETLRRAVATTSTLIYEAWLLSPLFDRAFAAHGWIAHEDLPAAVMRTALAHNEVSLEQAQSFLIAAHDREFLERGIERFSALRCAAPRIRLLRFALEDHMAGRFHASIPVVLAQIEGITQDLTGHAFFSNPPRMLDLPDAVGAERAARASLARQLGAHRSKPTLHALQLPYRHGVLHGRDLAYDTRAASAKAWAALLALRPWAARIERGETTDAAEWIDPDWEQWAAMQIGARRVYRQLIAVSASLRELRDFEHN